MKELLSNKRAEGYIDTVVLVVAAMMVIVLALNVFSFLTLKQPAINLSSGKSVLFL